LILKYEDDYHHGKQKMYMYTIGKMIKLGFPNSIMRKNGTPSEKYP